MSDSTPNDPTRPDPGRFDDETLSAHLDGELAAEERAALTAALARDPGLAARLETLRAAAALTATPVPALEPARVDDLISTAIAAGTTDADVIDLGRVDRRRRALPRWAVAAAVVVLVALAVPLLRSLADDADTDETADVAADTTAALSVAEAGAADDGADAAADESTERADDAAPEAAGTEAFDAADAGTEGDVDRAPGDGAATDALPAHDGSLPPALGAFADLDGLQAAVEAAIGLAGGVGGDTAAGTVEDDPAASTTPPSTTAPAAGTFTLACRETVTERARALTASPGDDEGAVQLAEAVVAGDPVVVALVAADTGVPGLVIVRADDCTLVVEQVLG